LPPFGSIRTAPARLGARLHGQDPEAGMTTAEYAVGTVAACGFAALLYEVVTSSAVHGLLTNLITKALAAVT